MIQALLSTVFSKRSFIIIFISLFSISSYGQDSIPSKLLENYKFRSIGPAGMSGRITAIKVHTQKPEVIYAGSASGGLWKSPNGGQSWVNIFKNEKVSSVGALAVDPHNPDVIWLGTGEGNPRNSMTSGYGLYKSLDGGKSWNLIGLEKTRNIHRILVHPYNPNIVYVAAIGTPWGDSEHRGVYKTIDGGKSWKKILYNDERTGAAELIMDPNNPEKLMVNMWEHRRNPWIFKSGGPSSGLYITYDGGESWQQKGEKNGLPKGDLGRLGLAIAASNSQRVYSLVEYKGDNALYRSDDGGHNWKKVSSDNAIGNRPFYYAEIYVDPKNEDRIFSLWSRVTMSEDGGKTWKTIAPYSTIHPDHHALYIDPNNPKYIINGNDGGLNISHDGGKTWRFIENIPVAQFYHINYDMELPYNVYGGMQDNGSWKGPAYVWKHDGIRNSYWEELFFGDGFDVVPDPKDNRFIYAMSQEGHVGRVDTKTGYSKIIRPVHPEAKNLRFHWNAGIAIDPFDQQTIYFGAQYVFKTSDHGQNWSIISDDLTTNDTSKQHFKESGGLTYDVTGAENYTTIISIEPSSVEKDLIWVGTDDGNVQITRDGGQSWNNVASNIKGAPKGMWVPQIVHSPHKKGAAFVVMNDYRRHNWKSYLYYTENYGKSFKRLVSPENVWGYCLSVVQDPKEENLLFLGTNNGLYFSWDFGKHWQKWGKDFPTVPVADLKIHPREGDLIAGTFGRSCLILDDLEPLRNISMAYAKGSKPKKLELYTSPTAYDVSYSRADGVRFAAHATFKGDNRPYGAMISYWNGFEKKDSLKAKKIKIRIKNEQGDDIRKLYRDFDKGFNRFHWSFDEKRMRFPGKNRKLNDTTEQGGLKVIPGKYEIVIELGGEKDSAWLEVKSDPRISIDMADLKANHDAKKSMYDQLEGLNNISELLKRSKKSIGVIQKIMAEEMPNDKYKALKDSIKGINKSIKKFEERIWGKKVEGYYDQPEVLQSQFGTLSWHMNSNKGPLTQGNMILIEKFLKDSNTLVKDVEDFYKGDWKNFEEYVRSLNLDIFNQ